MDLLEIVARALTCATDDGAVTHDEADWVEDQLRRVPTQQWVPVPAVLTRWGKWGL